MNMLFGILIIGLPVSAAAAAILYIPFLINGRKNKTPKLRHILVYITFVCFSIIIFATLLIGGINFQPTVRLINLKPFIWLQTTYGMGWRRMIEQLVLNYFMFLPLGFLLPLATKRFRSFWGSAAILLCTTVMIETLQYFTGRSADIDDIILNFLGGVSGYTLYTLSNHYLHHHTWWKQLKGD